MDYVLSIAMKTHLKIYWCLIYWTVFYVFFFHLHKCKVISIIWEYTISLHNRIIVKYSTFLKPFSSSSFTKVNVPKAIWNVENSSHYQVKSPFRNCLRNVAHQRTQPRFCTVKSLRKTLWQQSKLSFAITGKNLQTKIGFRCP